MGRHNITGVLWLEGAGNGEFWRIKRARVVNGVLKNVNNTPNVYQSIRLISFALFVIAVFGLVFVNKKSYTEHSVY